MGRKTNNNSCLVCESPKAISQFGALTCRACGAFFRRLVLSNRNYDCDCETRLRGKVESEVARKQRISKCRGCRMRRCFEAGMKKETVKKGKIKKEPVDVKVEVEEDCDKQSDIFSNSEDALKIVHMKKLLEMEEKFKKLNANAMLERCPQILHNLERKESERIEYFTKVLGAHRRITQRCFDLPDEYLNKFSSIDQVIDGRNILSLADCYSVRTFFLMRKMRMQPYQQQDSSSADACAIGKLYKEMIQFDMHFQHPLIKKGHLVFHLMIVGVLKAMPAFGKLNLDDRAILVRELGYQINNLTGAYYSVEIGQQSVTGPMGVSIIGVINKKYEEIPIIQNLLPKIYIHPIEAFRRIPMLSEEEISLLLAILCSNYAIHGLSDHAKEVLYKDQCLYSRLLLDHCQHRTGDAAKGAQRYGECLLLIESAYMSVQNFELMNTYREVFLTGKKLFEEISPSECIKSLIK